MTRLRGSRHDDGKASRGLKIKKEILKQNQSSNFFSILILNGFGHTSVSQDTNGVFHTKTREKEKHLLRMALPWMCDLSFRTMTHRRFVCSSFTAIYTEMEYGTRPLTVILKSSGMVLAITVVSVLKVRRTIGRENFLIPLRNR